MLLPKFASHISTFKLSHFANRGHQHFQNLRNTFTNLNLGSSVGQNSHPTSSTTATGLGSSASGPSASGAGGSKWSAGSRTNWNQQTHGRLINHTNPLSQDGLGSRLNEDDEEHDEFSNQHLSTIGLYNKRNRTISSRWNYAQDRPNSISSTALDNTSLQIRCKSAFINLNKVNLNGDTSVDGPEQITPSLPAQRVPNHPAFLIRRPLRRHSIHNLASPEPISEESTTRLRRFSTGAHQNPVNSTRPPHVKDVAKNPLQRKYSIVVPQQPTDVAVPNNVPFMATQTFVDSTDSSRQTNNFSEPKTRSTDEQWLQRVINLLKLTEQNHYVTFYQLRKLLDSYISSTTTPNPDIIDISFWGMITNKPSFEPISNLLKCHQFLIKSAAFRPTPQTYSILLSGLCQRDVSNAKELEHRTNRLASISVNQQLNQSLPNLSLAPVSTTDDVRMIGQLTAEPNYGYAARLFHSLDRELVNQLQPAALEDLIRCCANVDPLRHPQFATDTAARLDLATKAFGLLEDRQALTAECYSSLITLFGFTKNLPRAKSLFETYKQSRINPNKDVQNSVLYHQHFLQPPPSFSESLPLKMCQPEPVNEHSDAQVLLALMRAHLANGDSISALGLLEESLSPTADPSHDFKSSAAHVLEIILGFIRSNDYSSASKWIKRFFNGDHAMYQLDDPNRRREFMDRIVNLACEPSRGFDGLGVAYDAAIISIDQIDSQFDRKAMAALMARLRNVLNSCLVHALHQSACLDSPNVPITPIAISKIQGSLDKACSIVCYIISKRSALLKNDNRKFEAISDIQTYGMIENLAKRVILSCEAIRSRWISNPSKDLKDLVQFSENLLVRLMSHYSTLPDIRDIQTASAEFREQSSYLTGLLTSYQSLIQPMPVAAAELTSPEHQLKFAFKVTTPMILNNMTLVLAMQFYQLYISGIDMKHSITSIDDWIVMLTVGAILEIQAQKGKIIPSIQKDPKSDRQLFLGPLLAQFEKALTNSDLQLDQFNSKFDVQLLLHVIEYYNFNGDHVKPFFAKLQETSGHDRQEAIARFEHYTAEGDKYLSNRFGLLRDRLTMRNETAPSPLASPAQASTESTAAATSIEREPHFSPSSPDKTSPQSASSSHVITSPASPPADRVLELGNSPPVTLPVPHPPFKSFNDNLSQVALSMFCSKDLSELDKLYEAVHQSTLQGRYLTADASSALIETYGRQRQLSRVREMYVNAHVALASLGAGTTNDQALRSVSWTRVEDRMIIGLAYCGVLEELAIHKQRLIDSGSAPSADAYAAMIQHSHETTDDASIALAYFEEAIRNRVTPNTFLCNTIISKLSKARRSAEALEVFEYMKQSNLPRNSVTFGAIINACSKTGDDLKAEELFQEMLRSKNFKARIPPFNTMIQLFTQNVKQPNREKVLYYYNLMSKYDLPPSDHTYNLLMQAYGFIEPSDPAAMEQIFQRACNDRHVLINGSHWSTLLNVKGCVQKDLDGALNLFDQISKHPSNSKYRRNGEPGNKLPDAICYEALFNVFLAFKRADLVPQYVQRMHREGIHMTAYVVNTLMKVYSSSGNIQAARDLFESLLDPPPGHAALYNHPNSNGKSTTTQATTATGTSSPSSTNHTQLINSPPIITTNTVGKVGDPIFREPSCYETMIRIEFGLGHHHQVVSLIERLNQRAYPKAIVNRIKKIVNL